MIFLFFCLFQFVEMVKFYEDRYDKTVDLVRRKQEEVICLQRKVKNLQLIFCPVLWPLDSIQNG